METPKSGTSVTRNDVQFDDWALVRARLLAYVRRRVENTESAEDIVQDVLERMQRTSLQTLSNVNAWLYRTAHNAIIDHYRRRRPQSPLDPGEHLPTPDPATEHDEPSAAVQELAACMRPFIERLARPYRDALLTVDLEGLTHKQAAQRTGITVSGMKSRVQRGRRQLGVLLDSCCQVHLADTGSIAGYERPTSQCDCQTS